MTLDIVIPSKNRTDKLTNCINSIFHSAKDIPINLHLYFSIKEEFDYWVNMFSGSKLPITLHLLSDYRVPDFWNSHLQRMNSDAMMYGNDDILLFEDCIPTAIKAFQEKFPDNDGVLGLRQSNLPSDQAVEGAFGIIGSKYADRFPSRQVFCPDYDRFYGDFEVWIFAKSLGKFCFCSIAEIEHLHPAFDRKQEDETHHDVRKWLPGDKKTNLIRKELGYLWGKDYKLVNKEYSCIK